MTSDYSIARYRESLIRSWGGGGGGAVSIPPHPLVPSPAALFLRPPAPSARVHPFACPVPHPRVPLRPPPPSPPSSPSPRPPPSSPSPPQRNKNRLFWQERAEVRCLVAWTREITARTSKIGNKIDANVAQHYQKGRARALWQRTSVRLCQNDLHFLTGSLFLGPGPWAPSPVVRRVVPLTRAPSFAGSFS